MARVAKPTRLFKPTNHARSNNTQSTSQPEPPLKNPELSAAEKMKFKATAAKAARAAQKLKNPSASRRSTSVLTDSSTTSIQINPPTNTLPTSLDKDISVPPTQLVWSPPIDPLLDIAALVDHTTSSLTNHHDIPVPNHLPPSDPTPSTQQSQPITQPTQTDSNPPVIKKTRAKIIQDQPDDDDDDDVSPRLKRKRQLEKLRKDKKNKTNGERAEQDNETGEDQIDKMNMKVNARAKRRLEKSRSKLKKTKKSKSINRSTADGVNENANPEEAGENGGSDSDDEPLDPTKVSMAELTNPHMSKGQASEILEKRLQLIIERRDREKSERMAAREEQKRQAKLVLINRAQSVKARRRQKAEDENENKNMSENELDERLADEEQQEEVQRVVNDEPLVEVNEAKNRKKKIMEEYGLENINSDDDLEDFEEVEYDEFANKKNKNKSSTVPQSTTTTTTTTGKKKPVAAAIEGNAGEEEEEEEEVIEEDFNVDDYVPQTSQYAPQLRVVDGQMVLDQDSLEVDRRARSPELDEMEVVEESDSTRLVNSHTWSKAVRGERWSADETCLFYDAVRLFGSDFEMISQIFPGRTRRQIRLKWNKEEKRSPEEITRALLGKRGGGGGGETGSEDAAAEEEGQTRELDRISEASREEEEEEEERGDESELVIPNQLSRFSQYAKIVGIDCTGPIPTDPMDKWREKERLEYEQSIRQEIGGASGSKKKNDPPSDLDNVPDDDDDEALVDHHFAGWGELD